MNRYLFGLMTAIAIGNGLVAASHDDWHLSTRFLCPFAAGLWVATAFLAACGALRHPSDGEERK